MMDAAAPLPHPDPRWALFLDVDGTLVEIAPTPDAVKVGRRLVALLGALDASLGGAVALVSGRPIETLDELFHPLHLSAAGNHGIERRDNGGAVSRPDIDPGALDPVRAAFDRFADERAGVVVEDKGLAVGLHYRLAPEAANAAERLAGTLLPALGPGFQIQHGKMMVEVRPSGADKGSAIRQFMAEPPFAGRVPVFIGDDVTDEDGFDAVNRLGGHSIRVGAAQGATQGGAAQGGAAQDSAAQDSAAQDSAAQWRLAGIDAVLDWLELIATVSNAKT